MAERIRILFLCTGNSCRSQMAEGLCQHLKGEQIEAASAGIERHGLNPLAVQVMEEIGIDISQHQSKTLADLGNQAFDFVITLCGHAHETCPFFPAKTQRIHQGFDDPPRLAAHTACDEDAIPYYRQVRDEIKAYILSLPPRQEG